MNAVERWKSIIGNVLCFGTVEEIRNKEFSLAGEDFLFILTELEKRNLVIDLMKERIGKVCNCITMPICDECFEIKSRIEALDG